MKKKLFILITIMVSICVFGFIANSLSGISKRRHFAEKPVSPQLSAPTELSVAMKPVSIENATQLQEITSFDQQPLGRIVTLAESPLPAVLQAVYENGTLIQWDSIAQKIMATQNVFMGPTNELPIYRLNAGINFNRNGSFLIAPNQIVANQLQGQIVWDTNSRTFTLRNERFDFQALTLHPILDMGFIVFNEADSISYEIGVGNKYLGGGTFAIERYGTSYLTRLALDPNGDYLATVDVNGSIIVGDISTFNGEEGFFENGTLYRLFGYSGKAINTVDLEFDETHSWLGWLTDEKLVVWSLKNYAFPLEFQASVKNANALSFDRTGAVLAAATQNGIKIFDVENGQEVANYVVGDVTAIYFTRDNRLLVWGDANGAVHFWGVKE